MTAKLLAAYPLPTSQRDRQQLPHQSRRSRTGIRATCASTTSSRANDNFFARWSIQQTERSFAVHLPERSRSPGSPKPSVVGNEDSFAGPAFNPTQHAVASYTKVLSPRLVNDFRVGFNRFVLDYTAEGAGDGGTLGNQLGVRNSNTHPLQSVFPIFSPSSYTGTGHSRSLPIFRRENTFQYMDNVTLTAGAQTLKFGANITRRQITEYQTNRGNGRFNFSPAFHGLARRGAGASGNSMASFILGYATLIEQDFTLAWTGIGVGRTGFTSPTIGASSRAHAQCRSALGILQPVCRSGRPHRQFRPRHGHRSGCRTRRRRSTRRGRPRLQELGAALRLRLSGCGPTP